MIDARCTRLGVWSQLLHTGEFRHVAEITSVFFDGKPLVFLEAEKIRVFIRLETACVALCVPNDFNIQYSTKTKVNDLKSFDWVQCIYEAKPKHDN